MAGRRNEGLNLKDIIRNIVLEELSQRGMTINQAAKLLNGCISRTHLYDWLKGDHRICDDKASAILDKLGYVIKKRKNMDVYKN